MKFSRRGFIQTMGGLLVSAITPTTVAKEVAESMQLPDPTAPVGILVPAHTAHLSLESSATVVDTTQWFDTYQKPVFGQADYRLNAEFYADYISPTKAQRIFLNGGLIYSACASDGGTCSSPGALQISGFACPGMHPRYLLSDVPVTKQMVSDICYGAEHAGSDLRKAFKFEIEYAAQ